MEIEAIVYRILPVQSGVSQRGAWSSQDVVFEVPSQFNDKVCISFRNDKMQEINSLTEGDKVKVSFNVSSREWNNRWYTSLNGWRVTKDQPVAAPISSESFASAPQTLQQPPMEAYSDDQEGEPF